MSALLTKLIGKLPATLHRNCSHGSYNMYEKQLTVSPTGKLIIEVPFNVKVRVWDGYEPSTSDQLLVSVVSDKPGVRLNMSCDQSSGIVRVKSDCQSRGLTCRVRAPLRSELSVFTTSGDVHVHRVHGRRVHLATRTGNITSDTCQASEFRAQSIAGCIRNVGMLHAGLVHLRTGFKGTINADHMQCTSAHLESTNGAITVGSAYCGTSSVVSGDGDVQLHSVHGSCDVRIAGLGNLRMVGFDGRLHCVLAGGDADLQLARLHKSSRITLAADRSLVLRLSESVERNTKIRVLSYTLLVSDSLAFLVDADAGWTRLVPRSLNFDSELVVDSKDAQVDVQKASWTDMLKLKGSKLTQLIDTD